MIKKSAFLILFLMFSVMTLSWISIIHFADFKKPTITTEQRERISNFVDSDQKMYAVKNLSGK